jgi:hypothetical protein
VPIREIRISAIRGIRHELLLGLGLRTTLVVGDNGTGKSSIVRGLMWALRGEDEPDATSPAGSEASFRRHILEPSTAPHVRLDLLPQGTLEVRPGSVTPDADGHRMREACLRATPFLLRRQLLEILTSRPIDRFRYLESFLDVAGADRVWSSLNDRAQAFAKDADQCSQRLAIELAGIAGTLPEDDRAEASSCTGLHAAICRRLSTLGIQVAVQDGWAAAVAGAGRAQSLAQPEALAQQRAQLAAAVTIVGEIRGTISQTVANVVSLERERASLAASLTDAAVLELIEHAQRHLSAAAGDATCPVCGNVVDRVSLLAQLEQRIAAMRELNAARKRLLDAAQIWGSRWRSFIDGCRHLAASLGVTKLSELPGAPEPPPAVAVLAQTPVGDTPAFLARLLVSDPVAVEEWMRTLFTFVEKHVTDAQAALLPEGASGDLRAIAATVERLNKNRDKLLKLELRAVGSRLGAEQLSTVAEAVRAARQDYSMRTLALIAQQVRDYYVAIHPSDQPDEATGPPSITIHRQREGTAYVRGTFNSREVSDPSWVYSDGHLDTVGICIFLALRRHSAKQADDARLIVLDDIVLSVDLSHARRLIVLLRDKFSDHQIVVLTHNRLFAHWYQGLTQGVQSYLITGWSLEHGPQLGDYESTLARLERSVNEATQAKEVGQAIQALMDEWLHEARYVFEVAIPAQRGEQYTMADIWENFASRLRKALVAIGRTPDTELPMLSRLTDLPRIRNSLASHENEFAREFPLAAIKDVARDVIALVKLLYCLDCKSHVAPVPEPKRPSLLECRCRKRQYLPTSPTN